MAVEANVLKKSHEKKDVSLLIIVLTRDPEPQQ